LPEGVSRYLATSDGLENSKLDAIYGSKEMLKPHPSNSLLPLKGDGCGNYDAVLIEPGPGFGAVVFWDDETTKAEYLIASSVRCTLSSWSAFLRPKGGPRMRRARMTSCVQTTPQLHVCSMTHCFRHLAGSAGKDFTLTLEPAPVPGKPLPPGARDGINPFTRERIVIMPLPKYRTPAKQRSPVNR